MSRSIRIPSLITVNQTPATIAINEDISINTGIFEVETAKGVTLKDLLHGLNMGLRSASSLPSIILNAKKMMTRIMIMSRLRPISPLIRFMAERHADRPDVTRRHITNQVQVPDGDTVILGGLRRKVTTDRRESIPFLGELPGLGKLIQHQYAQEINSTEMFMFITPHIVKDPKEQLTCLRQELLCLRPGDIPYFLRMCGRSPSI